MKVRPILLVAVFFTATSLAGLISTVSKVLEAGKVSGGSLFELYYGAMLFFAWIFTAVFQLLKAHAEYSAKLMTEKSYRS